MQNFDTKLNIATKILQNIGGIFEKNKIRQELKNLELAAAKEDFWKDQKS